MAGPGRQFPHDPFFFFFKLIVIGTLLKKKKTRKWGGVLILRCRINHQSRPDCEIRPPKQPSVDNVTIKAAAIDQQDPKMLLRSFIHRFHLKASINRSQLLLLLLHLLFSFFFFFYCLGEIIIFIGILSSRWLEWPQGRARVPRASPARRHLHAAKRPRDSCRRRRWRRREGRGEGGIGSGDSMNRWRPIFSTKFFFHKRRLLSISGKYLMGMSRPCDVGGGGGQ